MDPYLTLFNPATPAAPDKPFSGKSDEDLCGEAVANLQAFLSQGVQGHNFGLTDSETGPIIGKMFGVMVVKTSSGEYASLWAFSGKLAGTNQHPRFVPPIFDMLTENSFLNNGMQELNNLNQVVKDLESISPPDLQKLQKIKTDRKNLSRKLQNQLFEEYHFVNARGAGKTLNQIFREASYKNPPAGAGECAAPKLYQYAFKQGLQPVYISEFWWGQSPKSESWKHAAHYPSCKEKCAPILAFMLG